MSFFDPENLERMARESEESVRRLTEMTKDLASVTGEGESRSGQVVARTDHEGLLESIRLDPRAMRMGSEELGEEIVEAVRAAQRNAQGQAERFLSEALASDATREPFDIGELQRQLEDMQASFRESVNRSHSTIDRLGMDY